MPVCLIHAVDDKCGWCFSFRDRQRHARLSDLEGTGRFIFDAKTTEQEVLSLCDWQLDAGQAARDRPTQLGLWALKQCTVAGCGACVHQGRELLRKRRTTRRAHPVQFAPGLCFQPHGLCLQPQPRASARATAALHLGDI